MSRSLINLAQFVSYDKKRKSLKEKRRNPFDFFDFLSNSNANRKCNGDSRDRTNATIKSNIEQYKHAS
jgi:hypothetical protein